MADAQRQHTPATYGPGFPATRVASSVLVGRAAEVQSLRSLVTRLEEGHPKVALVAGEAGFGKSRLITTVAGLLRPENVDVVVGHCLDLGPGGPPYAAVTEALRAAGDRVPAVVIDRLTGATDASKSQLFDSVRAAVVDLASRRPLVFIIEDLHWADRATRDLLLYLLSTAKLGRWALVVTYRGEDVRSRRELQGFLATLARDPVERIEIPGLSVADVAAQVEGIVGRRPVDATVAALHRRSGGSPLLVEELVAADRAGVRGLPDHLRDMLLARVETLPPDARELVTAAAVCGAHCDEDLLESVLGWDRDRIAAALARCVHAGVLVVPSYRYRFRHELLREAVYAEVLPGARRDLHTRVAAALASSSTIDAATLAHHWYEAGEADAAARAALVAAASARRAHAPAAVHAQLERVITLWDHLSAELQAMAGGRAQLFEDAAQVAHFGGALARAVELSEESVALSAHDPTAAAARSERLGRFRWSNGEGDGAVTAYRHAIEVLPDDAPAAIRARVLSGYAWFLAVSFQYDEAMGVAGAAMQAADRSAEPLERCRALVAWAGAQADPDEAQTAATQARDFAVALGAEEQGQAYVALDGALRRRGAMRERADALREGLRRTPEHANAVRSYLEVYLLDSLIGLGRWAEADAVLDELAARGTQGMLTYYATAPRAWLAAVRGRCDEARRLAAEVAAFAAGVPQQPHPAIIALLAEAEAALWDADPESAVTAASRAAKLAAVDPPLAAAALTTTIRAWAGIADQARRAGRRDEMDQATAEAGALYARFPQEGREPVNRYGKTARAEISRVDGLTAPELWRAAVMAWDEAEDPYRASYARWRLAEALLADRSGRAEAKQVLAEARERAGALGAEPLLEAIEDLAVRSRLRPSGAGASSPAAAAAAAYGLTPREHEILTWVTAGRTNREIAEALWLSPRTVATHLSRLLRKLGVSTRTQVADTAHRLGLLPDDHP